ncbi:PREDICTED: villin-3-like isoform X1 [Populus euphratica]|uniref:Villin-3-like isoform X1 n=1 Tax=Populus euphratica TaxID=75702 RepID=A0AAJ6YAA3_POPEU|nr:PREDICTED: villin-3-like isoform X1 [Populus euphratica]XP_011048057.1 PREDICTED: villin-3-like isoform X1 [Populus euphratica]XP_011048058.1 PREDICTED: villin-3-like isoform X1 [Populus euphratica]
MSSSTKALDPAFQGVGQRPGTEIWRIENFQPVPLPKSDHGKFYMGDSYIVLQTTPGKGGAYLYDIHFWIGKDTSQDEAGTAAIKTIELDAVLGGRAVQHRELQGHESDKFLAYFKPCIIPLEGGVATGFKKAEEEAFETRLYACRGKRVVRMKQVPFARSSLNHDDVFILDTENKVYQFNGANSNIQERAKALEVIQFLKEKYHDGTCDVAIVDDGKLDTESDSGEFWVLLGGFAPIGKKVASEDDIIPETTPAKLYSIADGEVKMVDGELSKGLLENNKCYLLDCGSEVFLWVGRVTQVEERKAASQAAEEFVVSQNRPKATRITRLIQGYETHSFKSNFDSWPAGSAAPGAEEGRGKVAALLKQQGVGLKGMTKTAPVNEEVPPLLEGGGKMEVWCINGSAKTPLPKEDIGKFYSGDCYIILYTYHSGDRKEDYLLCCWFGNDSIEEDQKMAARLANTMSNSLKGRPVQGRIFQGKEPPQFVALFQPLVILKGGQSSGYKNSLAEKGSDETYTADSVALFRISGTSVHNNKAVQIKAVASSLNPAECFLLQSGSSIFTWHGNQSTFEQQQLAAKIAEFLKPGVALKHAKEGTESSSFWFALGGKQSYTSKKVSPETVRDPHLFTFSLNKGKFQVEEIYNFSQDDLLTEDILILDTHAEVFVWVGQSVDPKEKQIVFDIGQKYIEMAVSLDGLSPYVPLYKVTEGNEPSFFTTYFLWDPIKATVQGNSFQKKAALLFGLGHHAVEDKSNGNQGGPTQRASALAALSSAFNPSSGKSSHLAQDRSNGSSQGGPTQRASALAALSSAFNSSPGSKTTAPRPSGIGQGSQRAAAVAALSSVLTAEKKTPETSPSRSPHSETNLPTEGKSETQSEVEGSEGVAEVKEMEETASVPESNGEDSERKQDTEQEGNDDGNSQSTFSYDQLKAHSDNPVKGIDFKRREAYLSDEEFQAVFGVTKEAFYKMPKWKQDMQKKKFDLF